MSAYPKSVSYFLSRLSNFSRQKLRLQTLANTSFNPNDQIVIELPQGLLDMITFTLQGRISTNPGAQGVGAAAGIYTPFAEGHIDSIAIECGGVATQNGFQNYAELFKIFKDYQFEDKRNFRRVLQLEDAQVGHAFNGTTNQVPFAVYNWLGFLGSVKTLDTTIIPPVKIYIRLAPTAVLSRSVQGGANVNVPNYRLLDVRATVDVMSIDGGVYYNMVSQRLQSAPLEIPFENFTCVNDSLGPVTSSKRLSTSTDCLEGVIATLKLDNPITFVPNDTTRQSAYFTRTGAGVTRSVFRINGVPYPTLPCEDALGDVFIDTAHSLNVSQDVLGQTDTNMNSLTVWKNNYWVHAHSFSYPDAEDSHRLCGNPKP